MNLNRREAIKTAGLAAAAAVIGANVGGSGTRGTSAFGAGLEAGARPLPQGGGFYAFKVGDFDAALVSGVKGRMKMH